MGASAKIQQGVTLEEFLRMPGIDDEPPYLEFIDGRIEEKAMPSGVHQWIEKRIDAFAEPDALGVTFHELRHTFAGRSILPDVTFLLAENLPLEPDGRPSNPVLVPPDIHVEVVSPDQSVSKNHAKLLFSIANGCALGILVHPERRTIDVYRPGLRPERLPDDGAIDFAPVLPGLVVPAAEVFSWMVLRRPRPGV